jgi:ATP-GRASP peptide maturase of grasp-with-spasm system
MIIIISEEEDQSSTKVCEWLRYLNASYLRLNYNTTVDIQVLDDKLTLFAEGQTVRIDKSTVVWYRRGTIVFNENIRLQISEIEIPEIRNYLVQEIKVLEEYIYYLLKEYSGVCIDNYNTASVNKLQVLHLAKGCGLKVPSQLVSNKYDAVQLFMTNHPSVITKAISEIFRLSNDRVHGRILTNEMSWEALGIYSSGNFFYSLIQQNISKLLEIRCYYFLGEFYSMAILSQSDATTSIDFRNYNTTKPNRTFRYLLPKDIEDKLDILIKKLGLNTCSIDLILCTNSEYIFLEVNPVGQFGMVSYPCNYYLEMKIAKYLCQRAAN